jgi:hypothetical protein
LWHALAWLIHHPADTLAALRPELKACMKLDSDIELKHRFDAVVNGLKTRRYPTPQAIANTYEIATLEYPEAVGLNPMTLWDLHWVKELDDEGFIEKLLERLSP